MISEKSICISVLPHYPCIMYTFLLGSLYISTVLHRIEQEEFMGLNTKLEALHISLSFWVRMVLDFMFRAHHAPREAQRFSPITFLSLVHIMPLPDMQFLCVLCFWIFQSHPSQHAPQSKHMNVSYLTLDIGIETILIILGLIYIFILKWSEKNLLKAAFSLSLHFFAGIYLMIRHLKCLTLFCSTF